MAASQFMDYVSKFQVSTYVGVEDFADKFNFLITVMVLSLCSTIVTVKQYMMKPISCYMATDLGGKNLLDYVENYCWVQGTVPIALAGRIPETDDGWSTLEEHKLRKPSPHAFILHGLFNLFVFRCVSLSKPLRMPLFII